MKTTALAITLTVGLTGLFGATWSHSASAAEDGISKVMGNINIDADAHVGDLNTVNGSIEIAKGARAGNVATVNGSLKLGDGVHAGKLSTVNGSILGGRDVHAGATSTVNGQVFMDRGSKVLGDIGTVNGAVGLVGTRVDGGIEMNNGNLTVGANSHVLGGIHYGAPSNLWFKADKNVPRVVIGPEAQVIGALVFERKVRLLVHQSARVGKVTGTTAEIYPGDVPPR